MARYKMYDYGQTAMAAVDPEKQPGYFRKRTILL
jgi:hypothetical protein